MRKVVIACLVGLLALNGAVVMTDALAQQQQGGGKGKDKGRPPPPPAPRCPDLGVGTTAYITAVPGGTPLAPNEIAVSWQVRNDGNTPFGSSAATDQSVALEYTPPAGATQLATTPAIAVGADGHVLLAQNHAVRGVIRAVLPPEAQGRRLRLRLIYASEGSRDGIPDCNEANNTVPLPRPPATQISAPAP
jgi:hypothetical protein